MDIEHYFLNKAHSATAKALRNLFFIRSLKSSTPNVRLLAHNIISRPRVEHAMIYMGPIYKYQCL